MPVEGPVTHIGIKCNSIFSVLINLTGGCPLNAYSEFFVEAPRVVVYTVMYIDYVALELGLVVDDGRLPHKCNFVTLVMVVNIYLLFDGVESVAVVGANKLT